MYTKLADSVIDRVPGSPISHQIYTALKQAIIECRLLPGSRLSENEVSKHFATSRQPVREAFIYLAAKEFVDISPKKSTRVALISKSRFRQAAMVRRALELDMVRTAATVIGDDDLQYLADNLQAQHESSASGDLRTNFASDDDFHRKILQVAGCDLGWYLVDESVKGMMDRIRYLALEHEVAPIGETTAEHELIYAALREHDPDKACQRMAEHLETSVNSINRVAGLCHSSWFCD